jgi:hypothetical protein
MEKLDRTDFDMIDEDNVDDYIESMPSDMAHEIERYGKYPYYYGRMKSVDDGDYTILFTAMNEVMVCRNANSSYYDLYVDKERGFQYLHCSANDDVLVVESDGLRAMEMYDLADYTPESEE